MTFQHFAYGVDQHCHTMVGCNLRQKQLQQGQHLKRRCKLWAPTLQKKVGWAPEFATQTWSWSWEDLIKNSANAMQTTL